MDFSKLLIPTPVLPKAVSAVDLSLIPTRQALLNDAQSLIISDPQGLERARDVLRRLNHCWRALDESRSIAKNPFWEHAKLIDLTAKPLLLPVEQAISTLKDRIANYGALVEAARALQEKERLAAEAEAAANRGDRLTPAIVMQPAETIEAAKIPTRPEAVIESIDMNMLPRAYMVPNEALIKQDMLKGINVPGVKGQVVRKVIAR